MTVRSWQEIVASREEYETRAQSYLEFLKKNGNRRYQEGFDLDKYFERNIENYEKVIKGKDAYTADDLQKFERDLKKTKREIDNHIESGSISSDYFATAYARMRVLEERVRESKVSVEKQERVQSVFGDFKTQKGRDKRGDWMYKTSQELTAEKNERLAILNDLYQNKQMDDAEFLNNVSAVVDCYNIVIKKRLDIEVKESQTVEPKNLKALLKKVKNFFHIGKPVANVEEQDLLDAEKIVNNSNARMALSEAHSLTRGTQTKFLDEMIQINNEIPVVNNPEVEMLFREMFEQNRKLVLDKNNEEVGLSIIKSKAKKYQCCMSPLKIDNGRYIAKSQTELRDERLSVINYILKKYKHTQNFVMGKNGNTVAYEFEDPKGQELYDEVNKVFNTLQEQRKSCEIIQQQRLEKSEVIGTKLEQGQSV